MVTIDVKKELGSDVVTREHGRRLRELVLSSWINPPVVVNFDGLQVTSVSFFDEAFGQITLKYGIKELQQKVQLTNLDKFDQALLKDILESRAREAGRRSRSRPESVKLHD
jgi:hypothetical protein